jgi:hypothetical protein
MIGSYAQLEVEPQEQDVLVQEPQELEEQAQQLEVEQEHQTFMASSSSSTNSRISKVSTSRLAISFRADVSFMIKPFSEYMWNMKHIWRCLQ